MSRNKKKSAEYLESPERLKLRILSGKSSFSAVEAYKSARTNLLFTRKGEGCQKIAVTSTFSGEGKTINTINLGITMAQNGLRVLLIDADMRRPVIHKAFDIKSKNGLSELLAGLSDSSDSSPKKGEIFSTEYKNLYVLPSGHTPPNPAELLASGQMRDLLESVQDNFDYIIIDTPPVSLVTDAVVLSELVQGYVFVIRANQTPIDALKAAVLRLEQVNANIIGFILNDVDSSSSYSKYGKYSRYKAYGRYGRYGYGYGYGERTPHKANESESGKS